MFRERTVWLVAAGVVLAASVLVGAYTAVALSRVGGPVPDAAAPRKVWTPRPGTTWQWQIVGDVRPPFRKVDMYDVDLQDAVPSARTRQVPGFGSVDWPKGRNPDLIDQLHAAGIVVICYLDTGAYEDYRPDAGLFPEAVIGNNTGWEDENWLDIRRTSWNLFAPIIWDRLALAAEIGCDGVEPDQNNPLGNDPGFLITIEDEKAWYLEVAHQAHQRGLSVGMKNGIEVTDGDTVAAFDWALNEECFYHAECDRQAAFVAAGKALFTTEYVDDWKARGVDSPEAVAAEVCDEARRQRFSTLVKEKVPDALFVPC